MDGKMASHYGQKAQGPGTYTWKVAGLSPAPVLLAWLWGERLAIIPGAPLNGA